MNSKSERRKSSRLTHFAVVQQTTICIGVMTLHIHEREISPWGRLQFTFSSSALCSQFIGNDTPKPVSEIWQHRRNQITYFSSGGGGISWLGVFSISIIASGASGSGSGDTALSMDGAASPSAGSVAFPALLPNLTDFMEPFRVEKFRLRF